MTMAGGAAQPDVLSILAIVVRLRIDGAGHRGWKAPQTDQEGDRP